MNHQNATLFTHVTAVTMNPAQPLLKDGYVAVAGGNITHVGSQRPQGDFSRTVDCTGRVMMPGLVNAHTHLPMTLMRGCGGGCDLQTWLEKHIFPAEAKLDSRAVRAGTALAAAELIASGVTAVADMYYFCDDITQTVAQAGLSANISRSLVAFGPVPDPRAMSSWQEMEQLVDKWHNHNGGQILVDTSIHAEYTSFSAPNLWREAGEFSTRHGMGVQVHISETRREHEECLARHGKTPIGIFEEYGLWQARGMAAHCVWVTEEDMDLMARRGITAIHNPVSNLKLASGVARVPQLLQRGVNVALGTDGAASNNSHDLFEEIKLAALLHKGVTHDPTAVSAYQALEMATVNGARALGRNTGSLMPGKTADLILLDFTAPSLTPCHDIAENLVFSARGSDVVMNMARGQVIYENGRFLTLDLEQIQRELSQYALPLIFA